MKRRNSSFPRFIIILLFIILLGGIGAYGFYQSIMQPKDKSSEEMVMVVIPKGQSLAKTADDLVEKNLLRSNWSLKILAKTQNSNIQAGSFKLSAAMTPVEILDALQTGKLDYWVTFLEGWRREEFAENLVKTAAENGVELDEQEFIDLTDQKEGYLFPDTYLFPMDASVGTIVSMLESTMDKNFSEEMEAKAAQMGYTKQQILTMASLIEREARTPQARKMVAGILWKRIANSWPLQVDASLQYAKGYDKVTQSWWKEPVAADKNVNSAYNTYKNQGLPPGPICAPSLSSIEAALYPTASDYWYYITDLDGAMHYATTLEQHNQNVATYLN